eukprot:21971-Lingulodinium_polyedra.AAC.1
MKLDGIDRTVALLDRWDERDGPRSMPCYWIDRAVFIERGADSDAPVEKECAASDSGSSVGSDNASNFT